MNTPGPLGGSGSGACNEQAFDPGVLLTSRGADASLRQIVESREPGQLLSAEARAVFFGRFEPMARACPAANYVPRHLRAVCCGNATYQRRWCGPVRRHQRACRRAWRSLQPALDPSDRSAMLRLTLTLTLTLTLSPSPNPNPNPNPNQVGDAARPRRERAAVGGVVESEASA